MPLIITALFSSNPLFRFALKMSALVNQDIFSLFPQISRCTLFSLPQAWKNIWNGHLSNYLDLFFFFKKLDLCHVMQIKNKNKKHEVTHSCWSDPFKQKCICCYSIWYSLVVVKVTLASRCVLQFAWECEFSAISQCAELRSRSPFDLIERKMRSTVTQLQARAPFFLCPKRLLSQHVLNTKQHVDATNQCGAF